jgi:tellurium resistance protein TerD
MAINLQKGANANLSREAPGLSRVLIGLGWNARSTSGDDFDLDASAFLLSESGKVRSDSDFIFYNNKRSADGSVEHKGDNRTGAGDGDDEVLSVNLLTVPGDVTKVAFAVTIHDSEARRQSFGQISGAFIRVIDEGSSKELVRYDLSEDFSTETALIFGELYRHQGEWKFRAVGQGYRGGLMELLKNFGLEV